MLSDDAKRKKYDNWGTTSEEMGAGGFDPRGQGEWGSNWQYRYTMDPEELFRNIFSSGSFSEFETENYAESRHGFGASKEVY